MHFRRLSAVGECLNVIGSTVFFLINGLRFLPPEKSFNNQRLLEAHRWGICLVNIGKAQEIKSQGKKNEERKRCVSVFAVSRSSVLM